MPSGGDGVAADDIGHHAGLRDAQIGNAVDPQFRVHHITEPLMYGTGLICLHGARVGCIQVGGHALMPGPAFGIGFAAPDDPQTAGIAAKGRWQTVSAGVQYPATASLKPPVIGT